MKYSHHASRLAKFASTVLLCVTMLLIGCGTHNTPVPATAQSPSLTGAWVFNGAGSHAVLAASLATNAGVLSGSATAYGCSITREQTLVSGTISPAGEMILNTAKLSGGESLRIGGKLSVDRKSIEGTLAAVGGECNPGMDLNSTSIVGYVYAPIQGSYTGTFMGSDGISTPVVAVLSQSVASGPGGSYTLSGSVAFPSSPCLNTAAINSAASTVTGGALSATYATTVSGQQVTITATGTADPSAAQITITGWTIRGGTCDGYSGTGVLTSR